MTNDEIEDLSREWVLPTLNADAGIDRRWVQAFLAMRMADLLAQIAIGDRLHQLPAADRAWFRHVAENLVSDAVLRYEVLLLEATAQEEIPDGHS